MSYPILSVRSEEIVDVEQLGSKPKFWFRQDDQLWLFKEARANTGEDWAEKVAAEIAKLVGMPAARIGRYIERARGGIYIESTDRHGANPLDLIRLGCLRFPDYFLQGREHFLRLNLDAVETVINDVPEGRMSKMARRFALEVIRISSERLRRLPV